MMLIIYKHGGESYLYSKQTNWSHYQKKHQLHRRDLLKPTNIEKTELMNIKVQRIMPASQKLG